MKEGAKNDTGKLRYDLLPVTPLEEVVHVYTLGAKKYADRNWEKGLAWGRVFAAMMRHGWAFWRGERYDRECLNPDCRTYLSLAAASDRELPCPVCGTGGKRQHHLSSVAWCALALMEYEVTHPELDDRAHVVQPPRLLVAPRPLLVAPGGLSDLPSVPDDSLSESLSSS